MRSPTASDTASRRQFAKAFRRYQGVAPSAFRSGGSVSVYAANGDGLPQQVAA